MSGKLLLIILAAGFTGVVLLVHRQQRIETAHEMSQLYQQVLLHERSLWKLHSEIARRCRPEAIRRLMPPAAQDWSTIPAAVPATTASNPTPARRLTADSAAGREEAGG